MIKEKEENVQQLKKNLNLLNWIIYNCSLFFLKTTSYLYQLLLDSSVVEQEAVNFQVGGSRPSQAAQEENVQHKN